jgi:putative flippase GtrA
MTNIKAIFNKYKDVIAYLFFGGVTTLVNWVTYTICVSLLDVSVNISNVVAWIMAVLVAFVTNKYFVFNSKSFKFKILLKEFGLFLSSRIFSGAIEIIGVPFLIAIGLNQTLFNIEGMMAKIVISVIVVVLNYVLSKIIVFRNKHSENSAK